MDRKYDFNCIYYTNELILKLDVDDFYVKNLILPELLRYIILQLVQKNYETTNRVSLTQEQLTKSLEHAHKKSYELTIDDMVKEGMVSYKGIDNDGEYILNITEAGRKFSEERQKGLFFGEESSG